MEVNRAVINEAVELGLLSDQQAELLWQFFAECAANSPTFRFTHILYYLGGLIAIGAMSLFMTLGWEAFGGAGLCFIALVYAALGIWLTEHLLNRLCLPIPAGIVATFVVVLTPLAVYGAQVALGGWAEGQAYREYHTQVDWRWLMMELVTLACGAIMLWRYPLPFLVMPIAVTLWYMSMDLTPFFFGSENMSWELRELVSLWFGLLIVLLAFWIDIRTRHDKDFAFWLYVLGTLAFWGGLSLTLADAELRKFLYLCINLLMIVVGAILTRRVLAVFGGLGSAGYLGHLAYDVFENSLLFPFFLTAVGFCIIYLGILWQRYENTIASYLRSFLPHQIQELVANRR